MLVGLWGGCCPIVIGHLMHRLFLALGVLVMLGACTVTSISSSDDEVARAFQAHRGPAKITLFTTINGNGGSGEHSSLMIEGRQRVIYDPAGTFRHDAIAEQHDVVYGISKTVQDTYINYHARKQYYVQVQEIIVPMQVAELAIRRARAQGAVPGGKCAQATSGVLRGLPGFEGLRQTWFPNKVAEQFAKIPGARTTVRVAYVDDKGVKQIREQQAAQ